jgi:hypothetical protein
MVRPFLAFCPNCQRPSPHMKTGDKAIGHRICGVCNWVSPSASLQPARPQIAVDCRVMPPLKPLTPQRYYR